MKKIAILLFLLISHITLAQTNLAIPIDDKVYGIIKQAYVRGVIKYLSHVKPYPRWQVLEYLNTIINYQNDPAKPFEMITDYEKDIAREYLKKLSYPQSATKQTENLKHGRIYYEDKKIKNVNVNFGGSFLTKSRTNFNDIKDYYLYIYLNLYLAGDLTKYFSYYGDIGFSLDRAGFSTYPMYDFTKDWDTFHADPLEDISKGTDKYSKDPTKDKPSVSYHVNVDLSSSFLEHKINLRLLRARRDWGESFGSLSLSDTARPFLGLEFNASPVPWFKYTHLFGSLANWEKEPTAWTDANKNDADKVSHQKMVAYQKAEFYLGTPYVYLASDVAIIGAKRFELGYLSPLLHAVIAQSIQADLDNVIGQLQFGFVIPYVGFLNFEIFMDELEFKSASKDANFFNNARNQMAYQIGLQIPIPYAPFTQFSFQYTKIDPFAYTHYPTAYPNYALRVDTSMSHDDENLGYHLPPNSDEFLFNFSTYPTKNIFTSIGYKYIRHGDNDYDPNSPLIYGRINKPINYKLADKGKYPKENFTHDGVYDYTHTFSMSFVYDFMELAPVSLGLDYIFSYTYYVDEQHKGRKTINGSKMKDRMMNTLVLYAKFFY